jgi:hypothetical protein
MITALMARCLHIHGNGFQCIDETLDPTDFCESHQKVVAFESERLEDSFARKAVLRFVALVLLITLLVGLINSLKSLYWGPPVEAREVW